MTSRLLIAASLAPTLCSLAAAGSPNDYPLYILTWVMLAIGVEQASSPER
jgi:hypothetical protein